jgi:hypothetical protein
MAAQQNSNPAEWKLRRLLRKYNIILETKFLKTQTRIKKRPGAERRAFATTAELGLDALPKPGRAAC